MSVVTTMRIKLRPPQTKRRELKAEIDKLLKTLNRTLKKEATVQVGGSLSKDTWLWIDKPDIDLYVSYKRKYEKEDIAKKLGSVLRKRFSGVKTLHGSRDYFQLRRKQHVVEVVPLLKITKAEQAQNITDISPLHSKWVNKTLTKQQKDDVRLLKAFCKSKNIYGAESYIKGFSGYVCEILIGAYGSFERVLRKMTKQDTLFLDVKKYYRNQQQAKRELNVAKTQGVVIIIDPVQKERNAASAVSKASFTTFKKAAKSFLKKPSESFFIKKEKSIEEIKKTKKQRVIIKAELLTQKKDVAGAKAMKVRQYLERKLKQHGFDVKSDWQCDATVLMWFDTQKKKLSANEIREGPPIEFEEQVKKFKKKYKQVKEKKKRLYATVPRKHKTLKEAISSYSKDAYVKERLKNVRVV